MWPDKQLSEYLSRHDVTHNLAPGPEYRVGGPGGLCQRVSHGTQNLKGLQTLGIVVGYVPPWGRFDRC